MVGGQWSADTLVTGHCYGFTLAELIVVAVVIGVLLAGVAPRMQQTAQRLRTEQAAFDVAQSLRAAHTEAVTQARTVDWSGEALRLPAGIAVSVFRDDTPTDAIQFTPHGTSDPATVVVQSAAHQYQVTVDAVTSRVAVAAVAGP